jgi:hypothetical protein
LKRAEAIRQRRRQCSITAMMTAPLFCVPSVAPQLLLAMHSCISNAVAAAAAEAVHTAAGVPKNGPMEGLTGSLDSVNPRPQMDAPQDRWVQRHWLEF